MNIDIVQKTLDSLSNKTSLELENTIKTSGTNLVNYLNTFDTKNSVSDSKNLKVLEVLSMSVLCNVGNVTSTIFKMYLSLCDFFKIEIKDRDFDYFINLMLSANYKESILTSALLVTKKISLLDKEIIKRELCTYLVSFVLYINAKDSRVFEVVNKLVKNCTSINECNNESSNITNVCTVLKESNFNDGLPNQPITIIEFGASLVEWEENGYFASFGAIVKNPNGSRIAKNAIVEINYLDKEGNVVDSDYCIINSIMPNKTMGIGIQTYFEDKDIYNYKIFVKCKEFEEFIEGFSYEIECRTSFIGEKRAPGDAKVHEYNLINDCKFSCTNGNAYLIFRNSSNQIVGGLASSFSNSTRYNNSKISFLDIPQVAHNKEEIYIDFMF